MKTKITYEQCPEMQGSIERLITALVDAHGKSFGPLEKVAYYGLYEELGPQLQDIYDRINDLAADLDEIDQSLRGES